MSTDDQNDLPAPQPRPRGSWVWLGVALLAVAACAVNAVLEQSTLMKILSAVGALVCLIIAVFTAREALDDSRPPK
jgi:uncharacterized protein involved in response to NO